MNARTDTLAAQALQQLLGDTDGDGMPVILARRFDPQIPSTCNISDYGFEGLRPVDKNGKKAWEVYHDFVLVIDGETGNCRIPDTERNRKRLERLCKVERETVTRIAIDPATNLQVTHEEVRDITPTYQLLEQNIAQSTLVDSVAQRVMDMMKGMGFNAPNIVSTPSPDLTPPAPAKPIPPRPKNTPRRVLRRAAAQEMSLIVKDEPPAHAPGQE